MRPDQLSESARRLYDAYRTTGLSVSAALEVALAGGMEALEAKQRELQRAEQAKIEETAKVIAERRASRRSW